jgi:hypothetical protein
MSVQEYAERLRNTRTFTFNSVCGGNKGGNINNTGNFDISIPPSPFPQDVISTRAIFKLKSFYICGQTDVQRASGSQDVDDSGYYIEINGIGLNQGVVSQAKNCNVFTQAFPIYNKDGGALNSTSNIYQRISGGEYYGDDVLCSNPYGTIINVKVINMNTGVIIPNNAALFSNITFSIELIPDN